jgi:hypothetical protein
MYMCWHLLRIKKISSISMKNNYKFLVHIEHLNDFQITINHYICLFFNLQKHLLQFHISMVISKSQITESLRHRKHERFMQSYTTKLKLKYILHFVSTTLFSPSSACSLIKSHHIYSHSDILSGLLV